MNFSNIQNNLNNSFQGNNNMNNIIINYKKEILKLREQINILIKEKDKLNNDLQNANQIIIII